MTDNEIINALECCKNSLSEKDACGDCPLYEEEEVTCITILSKNAFDLINRQKAEIEKLTQPVLIAENVEINKEELFEKLQQSPIEILPGEKHYELRDCPFSPFDEYCTGHCVNCENRLECVDCSKRLKMQGAKELADKLKGHCSDLDTYSTNEPSVRILWDAEDTIDYVVKEMVEEENEKAFI